ncbi:hypothetical protein BpHYR1_048413 [Brachionus plicatilis]|uniref:Uncharacterized protein n=1 Tax=Brachionus plicatilis TaxID=10195 RepID=A0A3M7Q881_BRAPC|nr:hypothetical protein BpHYR1_048413 [Brachionus plicatilis]
MTNLAELVTLSHFVDQCMLQLSKTNTSKIVLFKKNGIEILKFDLDSEFQLEKIQNKSLLVKEKHEQIPIYFDRQEDFLKCVNRFKNKSQNEQKQAEEKLVIQLIKDSFEKTLTLENKKLNLKPEDYIFQKIVNCWKNLTKVYGFFTTVCQSSEFGKSRACQNLSKKAFVVYCCVRSNLSRSGYPKRSFLAKDLTDSYASEQSAREYFISYFNMFFHFLNQNPSISHEEFFKKFSNGFDSQSTYSEHYELIANNIKKLQNNCPKTDQIIDYVNNKPLVFVFDEVSSLLKPESDPKSNEFFIKPNYFILRSLISEMNRVKKIFVLFLDTFSSLSSFMPNKWLDPSKRASQSILIEPIYLLPNWDVFVDIEAIKTPKDSMIFENICSFGRPFLAKEKLVGGGIKKLNEFTINEFLAILSCRIGTIRPMLPGFSGQEHGCLHICQL